MSESAGRRGVPSTTRETDAERLKARAKAEVNAREASDLIIEGWVWSGSSKGYEFWERVWDELRRIGKGGTP